MNTPLVSDERLVEIRHQADFGQFALPEDYLVVSRSIVRETEKTIGMLIANYFSAKAELEQARRPQSGFAQPKDISLADPMIQRLREAEARLREMAAVSVTWSKEDSAAALEQGWDLFFPDEGPVIQRDDEAGVFDLDHDALRFVRRLANAGRPVAQRAITLHDANPNNRIA